MPVGPDASSPADDPTAPQGNDGHGEVMGLGDTRDDNDDSPAAGKAALTTSRFADAPKSDEELARAMQAMGRDPQTGVPQSRRLSTSGTEPAPAAVRPELSLPR